MDYINEDDQTLFALIEFGDTAWKKYGIFSSYQNAEQAYRELKESNSITNQFLFQIEELPINSTLYASESIYDDENGEIEIETYQVHGIFTDLQLAQQAYKNAKLEGTIKENEVVNITPINIDTLINTETNKIPNYYLLETGLMIETNL